MISRSKRPSVRRARGQSMRTEAELVLLGARDLPAVGDQLGGETLRDQLVALHQLRRKRRAQPLLGDVRAHRHAAHVLHSGADHHVMHARRDQPRGEAHRLLSGAALPVDRARRRAHGQARLQPCVPRDVVGLLADLRDAPGDNVLDEPRLDPRPLDHRPVGAAEQLVRVHVAVDPLGAVSSSDRRTRGLDDHDFPPLLVCRLACWHR